MKFNKILIVSLLLLAILAIGAVSASEDVSDDSVAAIEPTDEVITDSVEDEQTDDALSQAVEEEPTDEVIADSVEEKTADSNALGDAEDIKNNFTVTFFDHDGEHSSIIYYYCSGQLNGSLDFYVNNVKKISYPVNNGIINYAGRSDYIYPHTLGMTKTGTYAIEVKFIDKTGIDVTLNSKTYTIVCCEINPDNMFLGTDEVLSFAMNFGEGTTGTVNVTAFYYDEEGEKNKTFGSANIENGMAFIEISGLKPNMYELKMEFSTNFGDGESDFEMMVWNKTGNPKVSIPTEIKPGTNAVLSINADTPVMVMINIDGNLVAYNDVSTLKHLIPNLSEGTHNVRVVLLDMNLMSSGISKIFYTNNFKITVKEPAPAKVTKVATKIVAAKKTFKVKTKTKKYTITLKAGTKLVKKVKVTLKVGKKTYKATTNTKGKATFKITKLSKKGTYTATIKFAGNKNYKASSKKVKITVKK